MHISPITNATPTRKVSFGTDLTLYQHQQLGRFRCWDAASQRESSTEDSFKIQNENKTIIEQNEKIINQGARILRALSYLAQSNAKNLSADIVSAKYANMAKDIADGNK